jgi:hypothetical protein
MFYSYIFMICKCQSNPTYVCTYVPGTKPKDLIWKIFPQFIFVSGGCDEKLRNDPKLPISLKVGPIVE